MNLSKFLKFYLIFLTAAFLFNFIGHALILSNFDGPYLEGIRKPLTPGSYPIIFLDYMFLSLGIAVFIFLSKAEKNPKLSAQIAAFFGAIAYLNVGLTNTFLLPRWPLFLTVTDTLTAATGFALAAVITVRVVKKF
jgi:uncharacterized membrane protein